MFLRGMAVIFAIVFILLGIIGFIPSIAPNRMLFNLFLTGLVINSIYVFTGLIALSASSSTVYARLFFKFFGVIYACMAIWGFAMNGNLGLVHVINMADSFFHLAVAIIALYLGFTFASKLSRSYPL